MKELGFTRVVSGLLLLTLFSAFFVARGNAQSMDVHQLRGKVLMLRGRYFCSEAGYGRCTLQFDAAGKLMSQAITGPFCLSAISVDRVQFKHHALWMEGKRVTLLRTGDQGANAPRPLATDKPLTVEIAAESRDAASLNQALPVVFAATVPQALAGESKQQQEADIASMPLLTLAPNAKKATASMPAPWPIHQVSVAKHPNGVHPPVPLHMVDPVFTKKGRKDRVHGLCILQMIVTPQGFPSHIRIIQTLPDGLDEAAIQAVSQYRFSPATKDGVPVAVEIKVEINFRFW